MREMLQSLNYLCGLLLDSLQYANASLILGSPELGTAHQVWPYQCWIEGSDHIPWSVGNIPADAAQNSISFLCHNSALLADVQAWCPPGPQVFFAKLLSNWAAPTTYWFLGLFLPRCRTLHLPLLNCMTFQWAHFSSLSGSLWMAAQPSVISAIPPSFVSSAPSCSTLMKTWNRTWPSTDPWGTLLVTDLELDFVPALSACLWGSYRTSCLPRLQ